jgi:RNA polymerase sigma factor (sigma-70 family)
VAALNIDELVRAYARPVHAYLWRLTGDAQVAEDCLQETFLKAVRAAAEGTRVTHPRAWLYAVATNAARSYGRSASRRGRREQELDPELADGTPSVPEIAEHRRRMQDVAAAVRRLPRKQQAALLLRKYQGLDYDDIAVALGCSPESARANVYQALRRLRTWLVEEEG